MLTPVHFRFFKSSQEVTFCALVSVLVCKRFNKNGSAFIYIGECIGKSISCTLWVISKSFQVIYQCLKVICEFANNYLSMWVKVRCSSFCFGNYVVWTGIFYCCTKCQFVFLALSSEVWCKKINVGEDFCTKIESVKCEIYRYFFCIPALANEEHCNRCRKSAQNTYNGADEFLIFFEPFERRVIRRAPKKRKDSGGQKQNDGCCQKAFEANFLKIHPAIVAECVFADQVLINGEGR